MSKKEFITLLEEKKAEEEKKMKNLRERIGQTIKVQSIGYEDTGILSEAIVLTCEEGVFYTFSRRVKEEFKDVSGKLEEPVKAEVKLSNTGQLYLVKLNTREEQSKEKKKEEAIEKANDRQIKTLSQFKKGYDVEMTNLKERVGQVIDFSTGWIENSKKYGDFAVLACEDGLYYSFSKRLQRQLEHLKRKGFKRPVRAKVMLSEWNQVYLVKLNSKEKE